MTSSLSSVTGKLPFLTEVDSTQVRRQLCGGSQAAVERMICFGRELQAMSEQLRRERGKNATNKNMLKVCWLQCHVIIWPLCMRAESSHPLSLTRIPQLPMERGTHNVLRYAVCDFSTCHQTNTLSAYADLGLKMLDPCLPLSSKLCVFWPGKINLAWEFRVKSERQLCILVLEESGGHLTARELWHQLLCHTVD